MSKTTHINAITGHPLKATNVEALDAAMQARNFSEPKWATFQQWKGSGQPVRPRESGVELTGASGFKWRVFNVAQTGEGKAEAPRAAQPVAARPTAPQSPARKVQPTPRASDSKKIIPSAAPSAAAGTAGTVTLDAATLRDALEWIRRAVSTDATRYYLTGVYFAPMSATQLQLVATDGHRMHGQGIACKWTGGKIGPAFIMKSETVRDLVKVLGGKPREVSIAVKLPKGGNAAALTVKIAGVAKAITGEAVDGTFPDFVRVIPQDRLAPFTHDWRAIFDAADLAIDAAKAKAGAKRNAAVPVALDTEGVHLAAAVAPYAYFNAKYLRDMARMGDVLDVEFAKDRPEESPACIINAKANRWGVLMPMRGAAPVAEEPAADTVEAQPVEAAPVVEEPAADTVEAQPVEAAPVVEEPAAEPVEAPPAAPRRTWLDRVRAIFGRR